VVFFGVGLKGNNDFVALIKEALAASASIKNPPSYPSGVPVDFWSQYLDLVSVISAAIIYSLIVVFSMTSIVSFFCCRI